MTGQQTMARCRCGAVEIELLGAPIASLICHCDDCQAGAAKLAALPNNGPIVDAAGGTAYVTWRKDRMRIRSGQEHLQSVRLRDNSATARRYAGCCNTPLVATFDDARHWVTVFRDCIVSSAPRPEWRIMTRFVADASRFPDQIRRFKRIPLPMVWRLLSSRIAMTVRPQ